MVDIPPETKLPKQDPNPQVAGKGRPLSLVIREPLKGSIITRISGRPFPATCGLESRFGNACFEVAPTSSRRHLIIPMDPDSSFECSETYCSEILLPVGFWKAFWKSLAPLFNALGTIFNK